MTTSFIALGIAVTLVLGLVIGLGFMSLGFGVVDKFFGKAKLNILRATDFDHGFAFSFLWNAAKEPAKIDTIKVGLYNPYGKPQQMEVTKSFDPEDSSFARELDMGKSFLSLLGAKGIEKARVQVELSSSQNGKFFHFEYPGTKFRNLLTNAKKSVKDLTDSKSVNTAARISIPNRSFIADTVAGKGAQLAIPTNPTFEAYFANQGGGAGAAAVDAPARENFTLKKVWIAPGCIVCNACEDIYPEVFDVQADNCFIRPGAPLDDGLRVEEAAEACPVEVIKFEPA